MNQTNDKPLLTPENADVVITDTYLTGATSVGHEVCRPDQAADRRGVVLLDHAGELVVVATSPDERATPLDRVRIIDGFLEVEDVVQELVQVLRVAGTDVRVTTAALRRSLKVTPCMLTHANFLLI